MKLLAYKATWGMGPALLEQHLDQIAGAGYDGVELMVPESNGQVSRVRQAISERRLRVIGQLQMSSSEPVEDGLHRAVRLGADRVVLQGGRDRMTWDEGCRFLEDCLIAEEKSGARLLHETHRSRLFFNPWQTAEYLRKFPLVEICADFSHWVNVCERLLEDCEAEIALAVQRTGHIHTRVGHEQAPQVSDPQAPEWAGHLSRHVEWWRAIVTAHVARGETEVTFDPEFGPAPYFPTLPYTQQPVGDVWKICQDMASYLRKELLPQEER